MPRPCPRPRAPAFDRAELPFKATVYSVEHEAPGEPPLRAYYLAIIGKRQRSICASDLADLARQLKATGITYVRNPDRWERKEHGPDYVACFRKVLLSKGEYHRLKLMVEGLEPQYN
jgi:hypothetical protein